MQKPKLGQPPRPLEKFNEESSTPHPLHRCPRIFVEVGVERAESVAEVL